MLLPSLLEIPVSRYPGIPVSWYRRILVSRYRIVLLGKLAGFKAVPIVATMKAVYSAHREAKAELIALTDYSFATANWLVDILVAYY